MCGLKFEPDLLYDEDSIRAAGVIDGETLARARRSGALACSEIARGRRLYLGRDLLAWIAACRRPREAGEGRKGGRRHDSA